MANLELQQQWARRVAEFQDSGVSGAKWCQMHGYKEHQLWYWVHKFRRAGRKKTESTGWLQLETKETTLLQVKVGHAVVTVQHGFDPKLLTEIVRTVSALC